MQSVTQEQEPSTDFIFARADGGLVKINHSDILYLEGLENYVRIYTKDRLIVCLSTLKSVENSLPSRLFLRIHRSYIVNLSKVEMVRNHSFRPVREKGSPQSEPFFLHHSHTHVFDFK
jgi:two-component system LytT family response regulator